jgi:hypothetical protein
MEVLQNWYIQLKSGTASGMTLKRMPHHKHYYNPLKRRAKNYEGDQT